MTQFRTYHLNLGQRKRKEWSDGIIIIELTSDPQIADGQPGLSIRNCRDNRQKICWWNSWEEGQKAAHILCELIERWRDEMDGLVNWPVRRHEITAERVIHEWEKPSEVDWPVRLSIRYLSISPGSWQIRIDNMGMEGGIGLVFAGFRGFEKALKRAKELEEILNMWVPRENREKVEKNEQSPQYSRNFQSKFYDSGVDGIV